MAKNRLLQILAVAAPVIPRTGLLPKAQGICCSCFRTLGFPCMTRDGEADLPGS